MSFYLYVQRSFNVGFVWEPIEFLKNSNMILGLNTLIHMIQNRELKYG